MTAGRGCCRAGLKATPHLFSEGDGKPGQPRGESKAGYGTPDTRAAELDTRENFLEEATLTSRSAGKREANQASDMQMHEPGDQGTDRGSCGLGKEVERGVSGKEGGQGGRRGPTPAETATPGTVAA